MKIFCTIIAASVALILSGCEQSEVTGGAGDSTDSHSEAVLHFQGGQMRFKELVSTIHDEKSFDDARPELAKIAADWHEVAAILRGLQPPSEEERQRFRKMIEEGNTRSEPTSGDMIRFVMIESREAEILEWQDEFVTAAGAAGIELARLFGPIGKSGPENTPPEFDLSSATVDGVPLDQAFRDPTTFLTNENPAEQGSAGQPATRSESDSEGGDKPQPESEVRSQ